MSEDNLKHFIDLFKRFIQEDDLKGFINSFKRFIDDLDKFVDKHKNGSDFLENDLKHFIDLSKSDDFFNDLDKSDKDDNDFCENLKHFVDLSKNDDFCDDLDKFIDKLVDKEGNLPLRKHINPHPILQEFEKLITEDIKRKNGDFKKQNQKIKKFLEKSIDEFPDVVEYITTKEVKGFYEKEFSERLQLYIKSSKIIFEFVETRFKKYYENDEIKHTNFCLMLIHSDSEQAEWSLKQLGYKKRWGTWFNKNDEML